MRSARQTDFTRSIKETRQEGRQKWYTNLLNKRPHAVRIVTHRQKVLGPNAIYTASFPTVARRAPQGLGDVCAVEAVFKWCQYKISVPFRSRIVLVTIMRPCAMQSFTRPSRGEPHFTTVRTVEHDISYPLGTPAMSYWRNLREESSVFSQSQ